MNSFIDDGHGAGSENGPGGEGLQQFLEMLAEHDIQVQADGDQLRMHAPKGVLTPELRLRIASRKGELLAYLKPGTESPAPSLKLSPIKPRPDPLPLSFAQERLWFLSQLHQGTAKYSITDLFHFKGPLNVSALQNSLTTIAQRHEVLRTVYLTRDNRPVQVVQPAQDVPLPVIDLTHIEAGDREAQAIEEAHQERNRPFNLEKDLMLRAKLWKLSESDHIMLVAMHHIASDGWSMARFWQELQLLYSVQMNGQMADLPQLPVQYADYAVWQREQSESKKVQDQLSYWRTQLDGVRPLHLPADHPRPEAGDEKSADAKRHLSPALIQGLEAISGEAKATLFMTLLAAFQVLARRLTGERDFVIGAPIAGRNHLAIENLIGIFLNSLVLRTDLSGEPSFRELLGRTRQKALQAYENQDVSFEQLLTAVEVERDLSSTPLFQVFFNYLPLQRGQLTLPGVAIEPLELTGLDANFDLTLYVRPGESGLFVRAVYNSALFSEERLAFLLDQYIYLLEQIVEDPDQSIGSYSLLTPSMRPMLPDPQASLPADWRGSVDRRLVHWAERTPDHKAVIQGNTVWTYAELEEAVGRAAAGLQEKGVNKGDIILLYAERSPQLISALLGGMRAGAVFLILDPAYPTARLLTYLREAEPTAWIDIAPGGDELFAAWRPPESIRRLGLADLDGSVETFRPVEIGPDDPACITFTSGSTGKPKGVIGRHISLSHFLPWQMETFDLGPGDRFSMLSGLAHDPLQRDIFTPLWAGGSLHIPGEDYFDRAGQLAGWLRDEAITFAHLTPAMIRFLNEGAAADLRLEALRYAFFTGDKLSTQEVRILREMAPQATAVNSYGSTETQRAVAMHPIPPGKELRDLLPVLNVDQGIPGTQLILINPSGNLAGVGEVAEIHVRSPHLALGYLGDEGLTAERFITNPWTADPDDRLYRTGDLGRYLPDGGVSIARRLDRQIKIRGFRIEPAEIEALLAQHPLVKNSAVAARPDSTGDMRLAAYVVPGNGPLDGNDLRAFVRGRLPAYMVPAVFLLLDSLPLTRNGKVDYPDLALLDEASLLEAGEEDVGDEPRNETERALAAIWREVLNLDRVGIHDNFFDLGGHSLRGVQLFARIEAVFDRSLHLSLLFSAQTIAQLAGHLQQPEQGLPKSALVAIQKGGHRRPFFCVHGGGGHTLRFDALAKALGSNQPFYGLESPGWHDLDQMPGTLEELAALYVREIAAVQPQGPYFLGGYSAGGFIAFEMARQLTNQGRHVAHLAILDARIAGLYRYDEAPFPLLWLRYNLRRNLARLRYYLPKAAAEPGWGKIGYLLQRSRRKIQKDGRMAWKKEYGLDKVMRPDSSERLEAIFSANLDLLRSHKLRRYTGDLTLYQTTEGDFARYYGWQEVVNGKVTVRDIPGDHNTMLEEPQVQELARLLGQAIEGGVEETD